MRALVALNGKDGQPARGPQATFLKPRRALPGWLPVAGLRHWLKQLGDTAASFPRGLCLVRHDRRRLLWLVATTHPTAEWIAQQLVEACAWDQAPRYLIRDRDRSYGEVFVRRVRAMGIRDRPTSPRSPWQNGYAERLIGSIRRECIDQVIVLGERYFRVGCGGCSLGSPTARDVTTFKCADQVLQQELQRILEA